MSIGRPGLAVLALAASLLHVLNHALFKGLLFLGAGGVVAATGTRQIEHMGGLARRMPWTAGFFLLGAMAISGLPFLNGFVSEWLVFQSLLLGFHTSSDTFVRLAFPIGGALLGLTTALAAACFVKAFGITFLALPRGAGAAEARESSGLMLAPQAALALACVAIGLFPGPVVSVLARLAEGLVGARRRDLRAASGRLPDRARAGRVRRALPPPRRPGLRRGARPRGRAGDRARPSPGGPRRRGGAAAS